jgi:peptidoglycan/xylan/chitin deacetylase (PgdA/CDA1 family)
VKRMADEGHELANHSWSHPLLSKMSDQGVKDQLQRTHDAIVKATGIQPKTMRPPYGGFTERQRRWSHGELGYKTILWDVDPLDWKVRNAAHVEREILQRTVPGSIILTHDIHKSTVDAMPRTLDALLAKGFKFVTVTDLLAMDRPVPPRPRATPGARPKTAPVAPPVETIPSEPVTTALPVPGAAGAVQ